MLVVALHGFNCLSSFISKEPDSHLISTLTFPIAGPSRVRELPPEIFCKHGFVLGKASEAGFGNEMYKILTGAALSVMLNRSLIIGQTRHIGSFSSLAICILIISIFPEESLSILS